MDELEMKLRGKGAGFSDEIETQKGGSRRLAHQRW